MFLARFGSPIYSTTRMTAVTHSDRPPRILSRSSNCWWSPLLQEDALATLERLGAFRSGNTCLLSAGSDAFCPALAFEARASQKGTLVRVGTRTVGFGNDFGRAVQFGLSAFGVLVIAQVALSTEGRQFAWLSITVLLGWATCMALFSAARVLLDRLGRDVQALDRARSRAKSALFARNA